MKYYVWYHKIFGKNKAPAEALKHYGDIKEFYDAVISGREEAGSTAKKLGEARKFSLIDADSVIALCESNGWDIVTRDSEFFPPMLREISDCPILLFTHGKKEVLSRSTAFSVVGSRSLSEKAQLLTRNAAYNLAKTGAVIVSGAALGADSAAHRGAIEADGETVAVLGCGLGNDYMKRIGSLYGDILSHGVFVTELFPFVNPSKASFPERNRIISGISRGVLVTFAEEKSGTLVTAGLAKKQNRRVYAVAPEIYPSDGCRALIADNAYVFYNAGDMAYPFKDAYDKGLFRDGYCNRPVTAGVADVSDEKPEKKTSAEKTAERKTPAKRKPEKKATAEAKQEENKSASESAAQTAEPDLSKLSEEARKIYLSLGDEPVLINSFVKTLGIPSSRLMASVFELSMAKLAQMVGGAKVKKL